MEETTKTNTTENLNDGNNTEGADLIRQANIAAERLEQANKVKEELISREEQIYARKMLGGRSEGGIIPVQETEDEKYKREAKIRYAGTGLDPSNI